MESSDLIGQGGYLLDRHEREIFFLSNEKKTIRRVPQFDNFK